MFLPLYLHSEGKGRSCRESPQPPSLSRVSYPERTEWGPGRGVRPLLPKPVSRKSSISFQTQTVGVERKDSREG